jgi:hypothetical protein
MEFAAMLADEYNLSFISLSAYIQLTEFYHLLLLSSSSVFQSAPALGWTFNEYQHSSKPWPLAAICRDTLITTDTYEKVNIFFSWTSNF